jgi:hypothetical protein
MLYRQLESYAGKSFYEACDGVTQALLVKCEWFITTVAIAPTLIINCPDMHTNRRILNHIGAIATYLEQQLSSQARIRVCPPEEMGEPIEIRVDEIGIY